MSDCESDPQMLWRVAHCMLQMNTNNLRLSEWVSLESQDDEIVLEENTYNSLSPLLLSHTISYVLLSGFFQVDSGWKWMDEKKQQ